MYAALGRSRKEPGHEAPGMKGDCHLLSGPGGVTFLMTGGSERAREDERAPLCAAAQPDIRGTQATVPSGVGESAQAEVRYPGSLFMLALHSRVR